MPQPSAKPITFSGWRRRRGVSGLLQVPSRRPPASCSRMARAPAWRTRSWRRSRTARGAQHRDACAINFPTWRSAANAPIRQGRARGGARRRRGGAAAIAEPAAHRGRQVVRRPDDLAGAGAGAARRCCGARVPRLSAASGESSIARARQASRRRADPDAVLAGHPRCARRARASSSRCARRSEARRR